MRDPVLGALVHAASDGLELPVTILVGGSTIEGVIVSQPKWLDRLAEILERPRSPEVDAVARAFREARMTVELDEVGEARRPELIHLVDAVMRSAGQLQSVGLWRVQLEAVDGWKLGKALPERLRAVEG